MSWNFINKLKIAQRSERTRRIQVADPQKQTHQHTNTHTPTNTHPTHTHAEPDWRFRFRISGPGCVESWGEDRWKHSKRTKSRRRNHRVEKYDVEEVHVLQLRIMWKRRNNGSWYQCFSCAFSLNIFKEESKVSTISSCWSNWPLIWVWSSRWE